MPHCICASHQCETAARCFIKIDLLKQGIDQSSRNEEDPSILELTHADPQFIFDSQQPHTSVAFKFFSNLNNLKTLILTVIMTDVHNKS